MCYSRCEEARWTCRCLSVISFHLSPTDHAVGHQAWLNEGLLSTKESHHPETTLRWTAGLIFLHTYTVYTISLCQVSATNHYRWSFHKDSRVLWQLVNSYKSNHVPRFIKFPPLCIWFDFNIKLTPTEGGNDFIHMQNISKLALSWQLSL